MDFKPKPTNLNQPTNMGGRPMPTNQPMSQPQVSQPAGQPMMARPMSQVPSANSARPMVNGLGVQPTTLTAPTTRPQSSATNPSPAPTANPTPNPASAPTAAPLPSSNSHHNGSVSEFTMSALELFGYELMFVFGSMLTLGIAAPWLLCFKLKNIAGATIINGRRLEFNGRGGELFIKGLKWFFLSMLTFGIYSIWARRNFLAWVAENTTNA